MNRDLFISYARDDNAQGRITDLVERIKSNFEAFAGRPMQTFFDREKIKGMDDWKKRILEGLRESHLLLACLSPAYLKSPYCEWEFNEYSNNEVGRAILGEGVAPIYFIEVPGWQDKDFEQRCARWVTDLRRRQYFGQDFELRPWFHAGEEALREDAVRERMDDLNTQFKDLSTQLKERITRSERAENAPGNVLTHNPCFSGRRTELSKLRDTVALHEKGMLTAVHGLGGVGKTALVIEYAHCFGPEYGGGCWQVHCEGRDDLSTALVDLATPLRIKFTDAERDIKLRAERVLTELHCRAEASETHRSLLLLDNVDKPKLLEPAQTMALFKRRGLGTDWLHVIATSQLGESDLFGGQEKRAFLGLDELPEDDAVALIERYIVGRRSLAMAEREAARGIVQLLGGFTLAVESAAAYLQQFAGDVTCADFLVRLKKEGLGGLEAAAEETTTGVRHGEKRLAATLSPAFERLNEREKLALTYAALLPADYVVPEWLHALVGEKFPDLLQSADTGYPDPWKELLRRLFSFRLLTPGSNKQIARMHRLVGAYLVRQVNDDTQAQLLHRLKSRLPKYVEDIERDIIRERKRPWMLDPLEATMLLLDEQDTMLNPVDADISHRIGRIEGQIGSYRQEKKFLQRAFEQAEKLSKKPRASIVAMRLYFDVLGSIGLFYLRSAQERGNREHSRRAREHLEKAKKINMMINFAQPSDFNLVTGYQTEVNLASVSLFEGDVESAESYLEGTGSILRTIAEPKRDLLHNEGIFSASCLGVDCHNELSTIYQKEGANEKAQAHAADALTLSRVVKSWLEEDLARSDPASRGVDLEIWIPQTFSMRTSADQPPAGSLQTLERAFDVFRLLADSFLRVGYCAIGAEQEQTFNKALQYLVNAATIGSYCRKENPDSTNLARRLLKCLRYLQRFYEGHKGKTLDEKNCIKNLTEKNRNKIEEIKRELHEKDPG